MKINSIRNIVDPNISSADALDLMIDQGHINIAVFVPSDNYNIVYASKTFVSEACITPGEVKKCFADGLYGIHPDDLEKVKDSLQKALKKEITVDIRRVAEKSGAIIWLRCKAFPAGFAENKNAVAVIIRNITADVTIEEDMRCRNERYKIYEMTTPAVLFEYNPTEDKMIFSSNSGSGITQTVLNEYMDKFKTSPLVHPEDRDRFITALLSACEVPVTATLEYRSMVIGGGYKWCRTYYSSAADDSGKVTAVFGRIQDISTEIAQNRELLRKAEIDPLTGLYNRASFESHVKSAMEKVRKREKLFFAIADIDDFKHFNDKYGHSTGDKVLTAISSLMEKYFSGEITGRFGGDEFLLFTAAADLNSVREKLSKLADEAHIEVNGEDVQISLSIGAFITSDKSVTFEQLFEAADQVMYKAKNNGKNVIVVKEDEKIKV
ncbi:MAG: diguanylate cyclase [Oscillospiraceae bacterium]